MPTNDTAILNKKNWIYHAIFTIINEILISKDYWINK